MDQIVKVLTDINKPSSSYLRRLGCVEVDLDYLL